MADTQAVKPTVTLHWLELSRSQRIVWLLQECKDIDFKTEVYKRQSDKLAPPELKQIHPLGKSPLVTISSPNIAKPIVLAESGNLTEYLADHFATHLIPTKWQAGKENQVGGETEEWMRYSYYLQYAEGSLMSLLMVGLFIDQIRNAPVPFFIKPITKTIAGRVDAAYLTANYATHFAFLESQLASSPQGGKYLCGKDLTAADILMSFPIMAAKAQLLKKAEYPKLYAYAEMLEGHEGFKRSVKYIEEVTGEPFKATFR
ncbi:unnamed protein product [Zymoseptoria tritici ST99CH_1A5]|uniref:GST N-terminal domain-containing protein n=2 Tax=Zymoseptoria tritici TaxID=1047171 RepID=F9X4D9_ZYMTI|nr:uncharacterized protein MYCGRDRAFT_103202 [Zymoseptoria tritici IPO323]EGP89879.1 hypothetical protein MYCGRDRAFT_103202 [Zymoseptoria tritici IPO323]SMY21211.1 unnamed protein product [Zymoseptoria tritici ST99CH_1A5]